VLSVQHGASTLPDKYFVIFPAMHVAEIHLATGFQNIVWDVLEKSDKKLFEKMKQVAFEKFSDKIKKHETEAVGFMKERKAVTQFVKKDLLLTPAVQKIEKAIEQECTKLFYSLFSIFVSKKGNIDSGDRAD
jgi:TRAP-type C4-dicarboxylate transport system substrate-binding protein